MHNIPGHLIKIIFFSALIFRIWGTTTDLPHIYNPDEPHHLNIAARFGSGDFNPHDFKYPTLWPTVLAGMFGILYVISRTTQIVSSTSEFAGLYLYHPSTFYFCARLISSLAISIGITFFFIAIRRRSNLFISLIATSMMAVLPIFIQYGGEATPYGLMLLFLFGSFYFFQTYMINNHLKDFLSGAACVGLAASCHYTAGVFVAWVFFFYYSNDTLRQKKSILPLALSICAVAFFIGTPFAALDPKTFLNSLLGLKNSQDTALWNEHRFSFSRLIDIGKNIFQYFDKNGIGFFLALIGFISMKKQQRTEFLGWLSPLLILLPALALSTFGTGDRYLMGVFIPLIVLSAYGFVDFWNRMRGNRGLQVTFLVVVFLAPAFSLFTAIHKKSLTDTRTLAQTWIKLNIHENKKLLLTDPFLVPSITRNRSQTIRLLHQTTSLNHPRRDYYRFLLEQHPGGGYELFYLRRTVQEIMDVPERVEPAYAAQEWFDLDKTGIQTLKDAGVHYVILDENMRRNRENSEWLMELNTHYLRAAHFTPHRRLLKGPEIEIFDLTTSF